MREKADVNEKRRPRANPVNDNRKRNLNENALRKRSLKLDSALLGLDVNVVPTIWFPAGALNWL